MKFLTFEEAEKRSLRRLQEVAHIHEAGHVIAARYCQLEIVSADVHTRGKHGGLVRYASTFVDYSTSKGLPKDRNEAWTAFNRQIFQLLAGAAAQAIFLYENNIPTLNDLKSIQPETYGILLEFSNDESF